MNRNWVEPGLNVGYSQPGLNPLLGGHMKRVYVNGHRIRETYRNSLYFRAKIFRDKSFRVEIFRMIYVNDCSIRVVRS